MDEVAQMDSFFASLIDGFLHGKARKLEKDALFQTDKIIKESLSKYSCDKVVVSKEDFACSVKITIKLCKKGE